MILDVDLSQIEWRAAAFLSQDPVMCGEIRAGQDQHAFTCTELMELPLTKENRTDAKIFNFRFIYADLDTAAYAYYMDVNMPNFSQKKWDNIIQGAADKYSGLAKWHEEIVNEVRKSGMLIGPTGRRWYFKKEMKRGGYKDYSKPKIYNYPVQGTSGDLIKLAMVVANKRRLKAGLTESKQIITVHDSYIWDSPENEVEKLARIILEVFQELPDLCKKHFGFYINVPITGEATWGLNWGDQTSELII